MKVWLAQDPNTGRIQMQLEPFLREHLPAGRAGEGWTTREGEVDEEMWSLLLQGRLDRSGMHSMAVEAWGEDPGIPRDAYS